MVLLLALACSPSPRLLTDPDAARDGTDGAEGPHGAAAITRRYPARITDVVPTEIVYPCDADGDVLPGPWPLAVWVHGGLVEPERYSGNASSALDGALADADGGWLDGSLDPDAPIVVGGHSPGGTTAALAWVARAVLAQVDGDSPRFRSGGRPAHRPLTRAISAVDHQMCRLEAGTHEILRSDRLPANRPRRGDAGGGRGRPPLRGRSGLDQPERAPL